MGSERTNRVMRTLRTAALRGAPAQLTDGQLLGRYVEGRDEAAFAALVRRHGPMVLGVCRRVLRHGQDAEDAFQAVFIVLARKAASIRTRDRVGNWLYGVAHHTALKARAAAARRRSREQQAADAPEPWAADRSPWAELLPLLDRELSRLPDRYRVPIVLCELEGKTHKEAARHLGCPEGTVSGRLSRGRALLAKRLARCVPAATAGAVAAALSCHSASAAVPALLLAAAVRAASPAAAGGASAASALAGGVMKTLLLHKIRTTVAALFAAGLIAMGVGALACQAFPADAGRPGSPGGAPPAAEGRAAPPFLPAASAAPVDGRVYLLVNADSGRCLSVDDDALYPYKVVLGPVADDAGPAGQWKVVRRGEYWQLLNRKSGLALGVPPDRQGSGAPVTQMQPIEPGGGPEPAPPGGGDPPRWRLGHGIFVEIKPQDQQWRLVKAGDQYFVRSRLHDAALSAAGAKEAPRTRRSRAAQSGHTPEQIWALQPAPEGPAP